MEFETVEQCGRVHVVKNGVESLSFARQKPGGVWALMKPYTQCLGTLKETLAMIAADLGDWYTAAQAAARLVELGAFDAPPSPHDVCLWARLGLFPGAMKIQGPGGAGQGGSWRIPAKALDAFAAERRKEQ